MRRAILVLTALIALSGLLLAAALHFEGPRLVEHALRYGAQAFGYREVSVEVRSLGARRLELARFAAGPAPGLSANDIRLEWSVRQLLRGRLASVRVGSAVLHGLWNEDGIVFPVLPPSEAGPWIRPPLYDRLEIGRARLDLGGEKGPLSVHIHDVELGALPGERLRARGQARVEREAGDLAARVDLVLDGRRVSGEATLRSQDGSLDLAADLGKPGPAPGRFPDVERVEDLEIAGHVAVEADDANLSPLTPSLTANGSIDFELVDGHLRVRSDALDLAGFGMDLAGLDVAVELSSLAPPAASPGQRVSVETLKFGMDVGGGVLRFGVDRNGVVAIESLDWRFEGGTLTTQGRFDPGSAQNALVVGVEAVDLAKLVADLGRDDLAASGRLSGELPLRFEGDRIFAVGGRLTASEEGGVIRYQAGGLEPPGAGSETPAQTGGGAAGGMGLVLDALRNFQYRTFEVGVDGELTGEMTLRLTLEGANPAVYDGYPFQINLNLEGPLADVVRGSTTGFRVQDAVEKRFQERGEGR